MEILKKKSISPVCLQTSAPSSRNTSVTTMLITRKVIFTHLQPPSLYLRHYSVSVYTAVPRSFPLLRNILCLDESFCFPTSLFWKLFGLFLGICYNSEANVFLHVYSSKSK